MSITARPLAASTPLTAVLELAHPGDVVGVWIDIPSPPRPMALRVPASPRWISLLLSADLASLLPRVSWVIVGGDAVPRRAATSALASARRLVLDTSTGPSMHPLEDTTPEAVLAERRSLRHIAASRVQYLEPG